jgi:hypothetical protein
MPSHVPIQQAYPSNAPDWGGLVTIGVNELRRAGVYGSYFAAVVAIAVIGALLGDGALAAVVSIVLLVASLYVAILLARHIMTGRLEAAPQDGRAILRLLGVSLLLAFGIGIPVMVLALLVGAEGGLMWVVLILAGLAMLYAGARISFFLPALALGDDTSILKAYRQTEAYWVRIAGVLLAVFLAAAVVVVILSVLGLPAVISGALAGALNAAAGIVGTAAVCHLYFNFARGSA